MGSPWISNDPTPPSCPYQFPQPQVSAVPQQSLGEHTSAQPSVASRLPYIILLVIGLIAGFLTMIVVLFGNMVMNAAGTALGFAFASAYLLVGLWLFSRLRLLPDHSSPWLPLALLWGAGTGMAIVQISGEAIVDLFEQLGLPIFSISFAGAWPEEIGKSLGVLLIMLCFNSLNRPWHGLTVGSFVGLGFNVFEDLSYGAIGGLLDPVSDIQGSALMWLYRLIAGPALHAVFTGIIGFGIGLALYQQGKSTTWRWAVFLGYFAFGFACHFFWNAAPDSIALSITIMVIVGVIAYGVYIYLIVRARRMRTAERPQQQWELPAPPWAPPGNPWTAPQPPTLP